MVTDMICCACGRAFLLSGKGPIVRGLEMVLSLGFMGLLGVLGVMGIGMLVSGPTAREDPVAWIFGGFAVLALICLYWFYTLLRGAVASAHCPDCHSTNLAPTHSPRGRAALDRFDPHPPVLGTRGARAHFHETIER